MQDACVKTRLEVHVTWPPAAMKLVLPSAAAKPSCPHRQPRLSAHAHRAHVQPPFASAFPPWRPSGFSYDQAHGCVCALPASRPAQ